MTTTTTTQASAFDRLESQVRSYSRSFPKVFDRALGATIYDAAGRAYTDFLAGCSSLNYGHNDPDLKAALIDYLADDGIAHGLDMFTRAKERFLASFERHVLVPRGFDPVRCADHLRALYRIRLADQIPQGHVDGIEASAWLNADHHLPVVARVFSDRRDFKRRFVADSRRLRAYRCESHQKQTGSDRDDWEMCWSHDSP